MIKRAELSTIWKHSRVYGLANILNRLAGLILLPIYLHVLLPSEFGILALVTITTDVLGVVLGLGLGRALLRFYVSANSDAERDRLVVSSLLLLVILGACFAALALPLAELICALIFANDEHVKIFAYANLATIFTVLFNFELSCLLARKASQTYLWASFSKSLIMFTANITLVVYADLGVLGVVLGNLLSSVLISGILLIELLRGRKLQFSTSTARQLVGFAAPLIPSVLIDTAVSALDKLSLNNLDTAAAVGDYSTGQRVCDTLQMFMVQPFLQIWGIRRLEALDHPDREDKANLAHIYELFLVLLCAGALFISLFAQEIIWLIASAEYRNASAVISVLACAQIFIALRSYFEFSIFHANATRYLPWVALAVLLLALPTYYVLVTWAGANGAAFAFLLMAATRTALVALVSRHVTDADKDLRWHVCASAMLAAIAVYLLSNIVLPSSGGIGLLMLKAATVVSYIAIMFYTPVVGSRSRDEIFAIASQRLGIKRIRAGSPADSEDR